MTPVPGSRTERRAIKTGEEQDAHGRSRHLIVWNHSEVARIKRRTRRRERRDAKRAVREADHD